MKRRIYVLAGEVSGDTHGSELMDVLKRENEGVEFRGLGGPRMRESGGEAVSDWIDDAAVVGVWEVLRRYGWFKKRFDEVVAAVVEWKPEILLLIDYPGFNLRLAKQVKERSPDTKIVHYVAPQVWAWNKKRIPQIAKSHDLMLCLFPFEVELFEDAGLKTEWVGHPLVDELEESRGDHVRDAKLVGLFPGSRSKEVSRLFPMMLESVGLLHTREPEVRFEAAAASAKVERVMRAALEASGLPSGLVSIRSGGSHELMQQVGCGVVASGTATLEAAYYGMPYCLVYRVAWPTYLMARQLVNLPYIGLINILAGRELVPEFIQNDANAYEAAHWLGGMLQNTEARLEHGRSLEEAASRLGEPGTHQRAADAIAQLFPSS